MVDYSATCFALVVTSACGSLGMFVMQGMVRMLPPQSLSLKAQVLISECSCRSLPLLVESHILLSSFASQWRVCIKEVSNPQNTLILQENTTPKELIDLRCRKCRLTSNMPLASRRKPLLATASPRP